MTEFQDIRRALEKRLATIQTASVPPIAFEGVEFNPPDNASWLRPLLVPVDSGLSAIGRDSAEKHLGLFLIDCFCIQNEGTATGDTLADNVRALFQPGTELTENSKTIRIAKSRRGQMLRNDKWFFVPVQVDWYTYI